MRNFVIKCYEKNPPKNYKTLAIGTFLICILGIFCILIGKPVITRPYTPYGYNKNVERVCFVLMYLVEFESIFHLIYGYKYLVRNNLTKHTRAKQLFIYLAPIVTFIAIILLGIFL